MATVYTQRFRHFAKEFVARGTDLRRLPVYRVIDGAEHLTDITYPACLKFMPDAELIGPMEAEV